MKIIGTREELDLLLDLCEDIDLERYYIDSYLKLKFKESGFNLKLNVPLEDDNSISCDTCKYSNLDENNYPCCDCINHDHYYRSDKDE